MGACDYYRVWLTLYKHFHVQFIDAGSTDGSWEKIKKYKFRDGIRCEYTIKNGCSIYEAWNIGYINHNQDRLKCFEELNNITNRLWSN